jgi:hypothetical protein
LLSLRGENFRWADLVSGNLKEVEATSPANLALWTTVAKLPKQLQNQTPSGIRRTHKASEHRTGQRLVISSLFLGLVFS